MPHLTVAKLIDELSEHDSTLPVVIAPTMTDVMPFPIPVGVDSVEKRTIRGDDGVERDVVLIHPHRS